MKFEFHCQRMQHKIDESVLFVIESVIRPVTAREGIDPSNCIVVVQNRRDTLVVDY